MKLHCSVTVINRLLPGVNVNTDRRYKNAALAIMKPPKESVVYLLLITTNNKSGIRYKIKGNIEKTFGQFKNEGKSTIRFKEPPHDLCITAEQIQLKNFMLVIKKVWSGEEQHVPEIINEKCIPSIKTSVVKMDIQCKSDYPTLKGFPSSLQVLNITNCYLKRFDTRIAKLKNLHTLCLDRNSLVDLPSELGLLNLKKLTLSYNKLGNKNWSFVSGVISKTLLHLDVSHNKMGSIPASLCHLTALKYLKLEGNNLTEIPFRIFLLPRLEHLDLSQNQLKAIPGTVLRHHLRKLDTLDISDNPGLTENEEDQAPSERIPSFIPSLIELATRSVLDNRIHYDEESIPWNLVPVLDQAKMCHCGKYCLQGCGIKFKSADVKLLANTFVSSNLIRAIAIKFHACHPQHL